MDPLEEEPEEPFAKLEREEHFLLEMANLAAQCLRGRKLPYSAGDRAQEAIVRYQEVAMQRPKRTKPR